MSDENPNPQPDITSQFRELGENIKSSFAGTVLEIFQSEGSKIAAETPIVKVADLRKMKVDMQKGRKILKRHRNGL